MRVLVVEDDKSLQRIIIKHLTEAGYAVDGCSDGEDGLAYMEAAPYDCVILDWMLPKKDGLSALRDYRGHGNTAPVLLLTARDSVSDRVSGLDAGADDYLVKPFAFDELLARVRALKSVSQITKTAKAIGDGNLSGRIEGINSRDEAGELASTFNNMLDELEVSFQRERRFTSDASHELRMPVTVISACAEDALSDGDHENKDDNLRTILAESGRTAKIIAQLLMLSRGYEGRCRFTPDKIELSVMVESVSDELSGKAAENEIKLHNDVPEGSYVTADQSLMTQLFVNLIGNAIKYGKKGGNVWIAAELKPDMTVVTVKDDGIGISDEDLGHIFERFYRADKSRDRSGSGLGLAIVKWIAELHQGTIMAESHNQIGSTFTLTLPEK